MYKKLCVAALCCGFVCCDVVNGMEKLSNEEGKVILTSLTALAYGDPKEKAAAIADNLAVPAKASDKNSSFQKIWKQVADLYKKLDGTSEFEEWCDAHPVYASVLKGLDWLQEHWDAE